MEIKNYSLEEIFRAIKIISKGEKAAELFFPAIDKGLISRLDHAAYLGRELARAEATIQTGGEYVQDAAPELELSINNKKETCACSSKGKEEN